MRCTCLPAFHHAFTTPQPQFAAFHHAFAKHENLTARPSSFRSILASLFPGVPVTDATNPELDAALQEAAKDEGLELTPQQVSDVETACVSVLLMVKRLFRLRGRRLAESRVARQSWPMWLQAQPA